MRTAVTHPMHVIGNRLDIFESVWIKMLSGLAVIPRPRDDMEHMRNDTNCGKSMAVVIEVQTPRVTGSLRENLKYLSCWMVTPDASIDFYSLCFRGSRLADF